VRTKVPHGLPHTQHGRVRAGRLGALVASGRSADEAALAHSAEISEAFPSSEDSLLGETATMGVATTLAEL
jgi:hypothetical protein